MFVSAILASAEAPVFPYQAHTYVLSVFAVAGLNQCVSRQYDKQLAAGRDTSLSVFRPKQSVIRLLCWLGFAELETIRRVRKSERDDDREGDWWTVYEEMTGVQEHGVTGGFED